MAAAYGETVADSWRTLVDSLEPVWHRVRALGLETSLLSARQVRPHRHDLLWGRTVADLAAEATAAARADAALARARQDQADHLVELDGFEYEQRATAQRPGRVPRLSALSALSAPLPLNIAEDRPG